MLRQREQHETGLSLANTRWINAYKMKIRLRTPFARVRVARENHIEDVIRVRLVLLLSRRTKPTSVKVKYNDSE